jgi:hypothetical protein
VLDGFQSHISVMQQLTIQEARDAKQLVELRGGTPQR